MKVNFSLCSAAMTLALLLPGLASAQTVVLTPLISKGASETELSNVASLISSELDFRPEYEGARELGQRPSSLNTSCLSSSSCLRKIARDAGADHLVAGTLATSDTTFSLDLVLYDANAGRTIRRQQWDLPASPEAVADGMGGVILELVTGQTRKEALAAEDDLMVMDLDIEDDFEFDDPESLDDWDPEEDARQQAAEEERRRAAAEEQRRQAEAEAARQAEEERRLLEEERRRAEEERRRQAEEERRRRAEEERRRAAEEERRRAEEEERRRADAERRRREEEAYARSLEEEEEEDFDPSMISFGSVSSDQIEIESAEDITFGSPSGITVESAGSGSSDRTYYEDLDEEEEEEEDDDYGIVDLDSDDGEEDSRDRRSRSSRDRDRDTSSRSSSRDSDRDTRTREPRERVQREPRVRVERDPDRQAVALNLRGGYSNFQSFNFVTAGLELFFPLGSSVYGIAGLESYSVEREIPPVHQEAGGPATEWNTIFPLNLGAAYKLVDGKIDPYFGGDLIMAQYYFDESGKASWSVGARARAGVDIMLTDQFGLNANAAVGYWSGKNWSVIQRDLKAGGLLPQISVGAVVQF